MENTLITKQNTTQFKKSSFLCLCVCANGIWVKRAAITGGCFCQKKTVLYLCCTNSKCIPLQLFVSSVESCGHVITVHWLSLVRTRLNKTNYDHRPFFHYSQCVKTRESNVSLKASKELMNKDWFMAGLLTQTGVTWFQTSLFLRNLGSTSTKHCIVLGRNTIRIPC